MLDLSKHSEMLILPRNIPLRNGRKCHWWDVVQLDPARPYRLSFIKNRVGLVASKASCTEGDKPLCFGNIFAILGN